MYIFLNSQRHMGGGRIYKVCFAFFFLSRMRRTESSSIKLPSVLLFPTPYISNNFLADLVKPEICFRKNNVFV